MKYSKVWGTTELIFKKNNVEVHRIEVNKGGYCSKHCHEYKYNEFYVESGKLEISVFDGEFIDETVLCDGESTSVAPLKYHKFEAKEDTIAYEIYYVELSSDDIIREIPGGKE